MKMGVESLALYTTGGQQIPILDIVQSSIMDVLFPEMTQRGDAERLSLWQRANVVFCFIAFPSYMIFFYFAPVYIETLFTAQYLAAVPLFRIYITMILLQCFDTGAPLRSINQNKYFILGGLASLAVNVGLILLLFSVLGFATPALARVLASLAGKLYCGGKILQLYRVDLRKLFLWRKVGIVALCTTIAIPALVAGRWVGINPIVRAVSFSLLYLAIYYFLMRRFKVEEVEILVGKVLSRFRRA
jgi:O-antigen/teichoic acid export membrane protein